MIADVRRQRKGGASVQNGVMIEILDRYHASEERTLSALDALTPPPGLEKALEAVKDHYERVGNLVEVQKEAYFETSDSEVQGAEAAVRGYSDGPGRLTLEETLAEAGVDPAAWSRDRLFRK